MGNGPRISGTLPRGETPSVRRRGSALRPQQDSALLAVGRGGGLTEPVLDSRADSQGGREVDEGARWPTAYFRGCGCYVAGLPARLRQRRVGGFWGFGVRRAFMAGKAAQPGFWGCLCEGGLLSLVCLCVAQVFAVDWVLCRGGPGTQLVCPPTSFRDTASVRLFVFHF